MRNRLKGKQNPHTRNERDRCRGRRGRLRRRRSTQFSPRRQWRRLGAAEEMEEKGGSELRASATTGLTEDWAAGTEEAFARGGTVEGDGNFQAMAAADNGVDGEGCGRRCWAWTQGRRRRRVCQETGKEGGGGSASAASRRKQRRRPRSMAATASLEAGTGGLMKTEMRPTATEKSEGREDPHVVGDGKEEGERETAAATKFAEDPATASRRRKAVGFAVTAVKEEKAAADGGGRGRRDRGAPGGRDGEEGGEAGADGEQREERRQTATFVRRQRTATLECDEIMVGIECHHYKLNSELLKLIK